MEGHSEGLLGPSSVICHPQSLADPLLGPVWHVPVGGVVRLEAGLGACLLVFPLPPLGLCLPPSCEGEFGLTLQSSGIGLSGHALCPQEDLKITHHADNTLRSFCKWQKNINMKRDAHPLHHDTAILLTRYRHCEGLGRGCGR